MLIGLLAALGAALAYGVATVLQAVGAGRTSRSDGFDAGLLLRLTRSLPYLVGLALDAAGFAAVVVALRTLPLFLVQAAVAASVGVTALTAARFLGVHPAPREKAALWALGAGLLLLAVAAAPEHARPLPTAGSWAVLALALPVAALAVLAPRWPDRPACTGLAVAAGLGFGGVGVAARALVVPQPWWQLAGSPLLWALPAYGAVALYGYAAALQRGPVTVVAAVTFGVETVIPALVGLAWLGDAVRPGLAGLAVAGFVVTLGAVLTLARLAEVPEP